MQRNALTLALSTSAISDRRQQLQSELSDMTPSTYPARRSCVEAQIAFLREAQIWRMRLLELTLASIIFYWLGFEIAARCL